MKATAYCDGRGNAGIEGACASVLYLNDGTVIEKAHKMGEVTNNVAEYGGVILTMKTALEYDVSHLVIHCDSQVIVHQLHGKYEARNEALRLLRDEALVISSQFERVNIFWISRVLNKRSDSLCRVVSKKAHTEDILCNVFSNPFSPSLAATTQLSL